eukprot:5652160-Pyramimonas_sp.AAC.1
MPMTTTPMIITTMMMMTLGASLDPRSDGAPRLEIWHMKLAYAPKVLGAPDRKTWLANHLKPIAHAGSAPL